MSISFKFTKTFWCYDLEQAILWAEDEIKEKYAISEITPSEGHTTSHYKRYLWHWSQAPEANQGGHFLIDSVISPVQAI